MKTLADIHAAHGLSADVDRDHAGEAQAILRADGYDVNVHRLDWPSSGGFVLDAAKFSVSAVVQALLDDNNFMRNAIYFLRKDIRRALHEHPRTILVFHSMGTVLGLRILAELADEGVVPHGVLFIGSPLWHPVLGVWCKALGFDHRLPYVVGNAYNLDDPVVTQARCPPVFPLWVRPVQIAVAPNVVAGGDWEHEAKYYYGHPLVQRELERLSA